MLAAEMPRPSQPEESVDRAMLIAALDETGVSQSELARRLGMAVVSVNRWARGKAPISSARWAAICWALGKTGDYTPRWDRVEAARRQIAHEED